MYIMSMDNIHVRIKGRIFRAGVTQEQIAQAMGIEPTLFSRILRGLRPMPEGFEQRIHATLDRLEAAEKAAQNARERALAEGKE